MALAWGGYSCVLTPPLSGGLLHCGIRLEATITAALTARATLEGRPAMHVWGKIAHMADPFGHGLCLIEFIGRGYDEIATGLSRGKERERARMEWLIGELVTLAGPAYFFLQVLMAARYRGRWRVLALVPLIIMIPLGIHAAFALTAGSNLWPLLLILASPVAFIYLIVIGVVKASIG